MRTSRALLTCAALLCIWPLQAEQEVVDRALESTAGVRLLAQTLQVAVGKDSASFSGSYVLEAKAATDSAIFALPFDVNEPAALKVLCDGVELKAIAHLLPPARRNDGGSGERNEPQRRGDLLRSGLATHWGARYAYETDLKWYAYEVSFTAGQKHTVKVDATVVPYALAATAQGPSRAFQLPLRTARLFAQPAGKLELTVTLSDDLPADALQWARPLELKRDGNKLSLSLDGAEPSEDLVLVLAGKADKAATK